MNARLFGIKGHLFIQHELHPEKATYFLTRSDMRWLVDEVEVLHDLMRSAVDVDGRQWWDEERIGTATALARLLNMAGLQIRTTEEMPG